MDFVFTLFQFVCGKLAPQSLRSTTDSVGEAAVAVVGLVARFAAELVDAGAIMDVGRAARYLGQNVNANCWTPVLGSER